MILARASQGSTWTSDVSQVVRIGDELVPLYRQDPTHTMRHEHITDDAYRLAVAGMVIVCTDVVLLNRERQSFHLATRRQLPMAGLWWIGGRMWAGETEREAVVRNFGRETKLAVPSGRFVVTPRMTRYQWSEREQEPQNVGSDNLCFNFSLEPSNDELSHIAANLDPKEYDRNAGLREFGRAELFELLRAGQLHAVIWDIYQTIFGYQPA